MVIRPVIKWLVLGLVVGSIGIYALVEFEAFLAAGKWIDTYPNSTSALSDSIRKEGAGTYSLLPLRQPEIFAICISVGGRDPRQVAVEFLGLDPKQLEKGQAFFVMEKVTSFLVLRNDDDYTIEAIDRHFVDFPDARNRCVRAPTRAQIIVKDARSKFTGADLIGTVELE
jgi:hypothetical protein